MIGVLVDHNIELHGELIWKQFNSTDWVGMQVSGFPSLAECGLDAQASDRTIWLYCQKHGLVLLTANRNKRGDDSLQLVIEELGTPDSLPVLTLANANRVLVDADYRELCAYRIADVALRADELRGTGRLFIP
jgi:hypothetical protein